jgi:hypothetical protein
MTKFRKVLLARLDASAPALRQGSAEMIAGSSATNVTGFTVLQQPTHGTLLTSPDGSFTYTADPGYAGPDGFYYVWNDAAGMQIDESTGDQDISDAINWYVSYPSSAPGSVKFAQLIDIDYDYVKFGRSYISRTTGGMYELDTTYEASHIDTTVLGGISTYAGGDEPNGVFTSFVSEWIINFSAHTWLMWTPPGDDVIDIPIQQFSYHWNVDATPTTIINYFPLSSRPISGTDTTSFPTWNDVVS